MSDPQESQKAFDQDRIQFIKTARQFVGSALAVGRSVVEGNPVVASKEIKEERLRICNTCEYKVSASNTDRDMCTACSCFLNPKVTFAAQECPQGKWGKWENK